MMYKSHFKTLTLMTSFVDQGHLLVKHFLNYVFVFAIFIQIQYDLYSFDFSCSLVILIRKKVIHL